MSDQLEYMSGFGNEFATEALKGALPVGQNSPQKVAYGLYAEQITGSAFTAPRHSNKRSWQYRIRPSVLHKPFSLHKNGMIATASPGPATPNQLRWDPLPIPEERTDFIEGWHTMTACGSPDAMIGISVHHYVANANMQDRYFYNADGELLIVPQQGALMIYTEMGRLHVKPTEICVLPRGIKFRVDIEGDAARGYICENFGAPFLIPDLGPIGANGLANPRDFVAPVAWYEDQEGEFEILSKFQGNLWAGTTNHSPLCVVAWHGNYTPYKYNLLHYNTINTVSFDHCDPSIFTVITSPTNTAGTANCDFVVFPERWMVAEDTFRPPWFHRNYMSEYMGLIVGQYDAKEGGGFMPGGSSLHNQMSAHGPDADTFEKASNAELKPHKQENTLAFMFETNMVQKPTQYALETECRQLEYYQCWQGMKRHFKP